MWEVKIRVNRSCRSRVGMRTVQLRIVELVQHVADVRKVEVMMAVALADKGRVCMKLGLLAA